MRLGLRKDIDWEYAGAMLARSDDVEQGKFFKAFVKECLTWGTFLQVEGQLAAINLRLTYDEKEVLGMIGHESED